MSQAGIINVIDNNPDIATTFNGNTGTAIPVFNTLTVITVDSTPKFVGSGSTLTLDFSLFNLLLGSDGSSITTGLFNTGYGFQALKSLTNGLSNTAIGYNSQQFLTSGSSNTSVGLTSLRSNVDSGGNVAIGNVALEDLTTGSGNNTAIGNQALFSLGSGSNNTALGINSGISYTTTESGNILVRNAGVLGESNTIRIGTQGVALNQQNRNFQAGITGVTVAASAPVAVDTNGQLSTLGFGTAGQILKSTGAASSPAWSSQFSAYTATAISYQVLITDNTIGVTSTAAARTITMPNAGMITGQIWTVKDESGGALTNNITINGNGANIDDAATFVLNNNYGAVNIYWNGTAFFIT